ncbi:MAG TPA: hypothetical protein VGD75_16400, partial [Bradyrhizobium sp.]
TMAPPAPDGARELFGVERLDQVLLGCNDTGTEECIERIKAAVTKFSGNVPLKDDQTLIAMRWE